MRWLEQYGAKAVPLFCDENINITYQKMQYLNGILFPGGAGEFTNGRKIFWKAVEMNQQGMFMPVFGICLGFEVFGEWTAAEEDKVLEEIEVDKKSIPLEFVNDGQNRKMFSFMGE